ncbi:hypothetical protein, partial [Enterobacter bugandensis]|uniref:hypothetical protein n=1 Tax=Enterobacter bugandensis TaxID=881260 RepID=UPI001953813F
LVGMRLDLLSALAGVRQSDARPAEQRACLTETGEWRSRGQAYAFIQLPSAMAAEQAVRGGDGRQPGADDEAAYER